MEDFIFAPIVLMIGFGIHAAVTRVHAQWENRVLNLAFGAHIISGFAQVLLTRYYFKGGDMLGYFQNGVEVAEVLRDDFGRFFPELVLAFLQRDHELPVPLFGGASTQSMSASATIVLFLTGNSLYAAVLLISIANYLSQVLLYRALKTEFTRERQELVLWGTNLLPSAVFWSSGLLKEPVMMAALGPMVLALKWLSEGRRRVQALLLLAPGLIVMAMIKPYVLMALSVAAAAFYLWKRFRSQSDAALRPFAVVTAVALGAAGMVLGNSYFGKADETSAASSLARQRAVGYRTEGGSNFQIDDVGEEQLEKRTLTQELLLAPIGLVTALFRPFLFEARNAVQLVNAIEATVLLVLFLRAVRRTSLRAILGFVTGSPALLFCTVFTFALAVGTGLSTTNMGTLSRYRAPMMPFFFTVLLLLDRWSLQQQASPRAISPAVAAR